ncbi:SH3 domain-binding protein 2 [Tiliqua scincoides]|uniref:SH3 domain-binding protein 2 n=1 Tax=Tiliqua scincoides TaxID=71010 RepID=UPI003461CD21
MTSEEIIWPVPMKAIGAQNLLTMPGGVTKSGYLHKKGGTQFQLLKWPLRFVIIHKGCIYYFKSSTSASPQGAFSLNGYNRVMRAVEETTSNNVFPFKLVHISKKHRTWFFSASSEDERKGWMASLRGEIDHYHEKKETVTDLSDSGSDVDSFYGSLERPINIKYSQHSTENSDYDQDEDEDYLQPDNGDCIKCEDQMVLPPEYPPPPVPPVGKFSYSETKVHSFTARGGIAVLPPTPPLKKPFPESRPEVFSNMREKVSFHHRVEYNVKPQSVCRQLNQPGPPLPPTPPVKKPASLTKTGSGICLTLPHISPPTEERGSFKELKLSAQVPPPLSSNKPKSFQCAERLVNAKVPRETIKPGLSTPKVPPKPQVPGSKPPVPACKLEALPPCSGSVFARRSPPDGQSFRGASFEKPALPLPANVIEEDSDEDYEKVELPNSIFVNTSESLEVERMFKSENPTGPPKNGLFCIRNSSTKVGKVLVVWDGSTQKVRNYRIFQQDSKFYLEADVPFMDLKSLVEHYACHVLPSHNNLKLQFPYGYCGPR